MEQKVNRLKKAFQAFFSGSFTNVSLESPKPLLVSEKRARELFDEVELELSRDVLKVEKAFEMFRGLVFLHLDHLRESSTSRQCQQIHREGGKINGGRRYFFIQQFNTKGWLVERSGLGWVVSRAEKIAQRNLFVRHGAPFDIVSILEPADGSDRFRIRSGRWDIDHFSLDAYAARWIKVIMDT
jgi:hypothetical protein